MLLTIKKPLVTLLGQNKLETTKNKAILLNGLVFGSISVYLSETEYNL